MNISLEHKESSFFEGYIQPSKIEEYKKKYNHYLILLKCDGSDDSSLRSQILAIKEELNQDQWYIDPDKKLSL